MGWSVVVMIRNKGKAHQQVFVVAHPSVGHTQINWTNGQSQPQQFIRQQKENLWLTVVLSKEAIQ